MFGRVETRIGPPWLRYVLLAGVGLVVALLAWWPMMAQHPNTPELDGQYSFYQFEITRAILLQYHELPLWNPYDCRGLPHWDFPESMGASPILFLTAWLRPLYQYYVWLVLHCAVGFVGAWLLVRDDLKLSRLATLVAACAWAIGAAHTAQYSTGHVMMVGFWNLPLLMFLWRRAETSTPHAIGTGAVLAWMVYDGGTYPVPFCFLILVLEAGLRLTSLARLKAIVLAGLVTGATGFALAAPRLLPVAAQFRAHVRPNPYPDVDWMQSVDNVVAMFAMRKSQWNLRLPGQQYVWNEYLSYLGYAGIFLAFLGMAMSTVRRRWLLLLTVITLVLMLGHFGKYAPWSLLQKNVFPFTSMRVSSRFRFGMTLFAAIFSAIAIDEIPRSLRRHIGTARARGVRSVLLALALLGTGDVMGLGYDMLTTRFGWAPSVVVERSPRFYYGGAGLTPTFTDQPRQNRAWLGCRGVSWSFHENAALWTGDVPQARAADEAIVVTDVRRTPNRFLFHATAERPGRVLLNSAYGEGWRSSVGTVVAYGDLLAVDLPAGDHQVTMRYWPNFMTAGLVLAVLGMAGIAAYAYRGRLRFFVSRKKRAGARG